MKKVLWIAGIVVLALVATYFTRFMILRSQIKEFTEINSLIIEHYEDGNTEALAASLEDAEAMLAKKMLQNYLSEADVANWSDFYKDMNALLQDALSQARGASAAESATMSADQYRTFVKTSYRCGRGSCKCSGYWGIKHHNGTYEGSCRNSDGYGHTCGHSPKDHGLRTW